MQKIEIWTVGASEDGPRAAALETLHSSQTEELLERLLVRSPTLLVPGLVLIGRQVPTGGGPLDLIGVDQDGRLVVFELKRGTLTREAVAQVLDYASDLFSMDPEAFARLVEENSGREGIEEVSDFRDWYAREFPDVPDPLDEPPRMVLVGLGVDERARRIVNFLASAGIEIQLLTYHAFMDGGRMLLARQVETEPPSGGRDRGPPTKEANRRILLERAEALGVKDFLEEAAEFVSNRLRPAYRWPGKTAYSYSFPEQTSAGRPSQRTYTTLYIDERNPGTLLLTLHPRAAEVAEDAVAEFCEGVPTTPQPNLEHVAFEVRFRPSEWIAAKPVLENLFAAILRGWEERSAAERQEEAREPVAVLDDGSQSQEPIREEGSES